MQTTSGKVTQRDRGAGNDEEHHEQYLCGSAELYRQQVWPRLVAGHHAQRSSAINTESCEALAIPTVSSTIATRE
jgi:hypothetical protein